MRKSVKCAAVAVGTAGLVAAGTFTGAGQAAAAGDLSVQTQMSCGSDGAWRVVHVNNVGDAPISDIRIGSVAGPEVSLGAAIDAGDERTVVPGRVYLNTVTGTSANGTLKAGEGVALKEVVQVNCNSPYVMLGYAIGSPVDNVLDRPNYSLRFGPTHHA